MDGARKENTNTRVKQGRQYGDKREEFLGLSMRLLEHAELAHKAT